MSRLATVLGSLVLVAGLLTACDDAPPAAQPATTSSSGATRVPAPTTVDTTSGRLHGRTTGRAREFLGVRYAKAPVGRRRWTDPVPAPHASGTVDATRAGATCAQAGTAPGASATASTSEDCLFLNVTTPRKVDPDHPLPVMVWWHGGGYTSGAGSAYDAQRLARRGDVMVVTVNYRLGVLGYLSLPGLRGSGDFGLADQVLATRWAKRNAAAFGGDPHNVTVFGESAGAMSACALLGSPVADRLVDKVAMSSGSCLLSWPRDGLVPGAPAQTPYLALDAAERLGTSEAATLGCRGRDVVGCLRDLPTKRLLTISPAFSDVLAYGTPLLPHDPAEAVRDGDTVTVPVLSTGNRDEERAFVGGVEQAGPTFRRATYPTFLKRAFGAAADDVAREYPLRDYPSAAIAWSTVITDASWACPTIAGNAELAAHGSAVFGGEFADRGAPDVNGVRSSSFDPGAAHATDVPYLFDLLGKDALRGAEQRRLADAMIDYWTSFARTGVPTADGQPDWPALAGAGGPSLQLAPSRTGTTALSTEHRCAFWDRLGDE